MVEFALVSPLLLMITFVTVDFGRLVYAFTAISSAAREGARIVALDSQNQTDCLALRRMEQVGQGFPLTVDPNSLVGNTDPNNPSPPLQPSTPPPGKGYIYIWPAVATAAPPDQGTNCDGAQCGGSQVVKHVAVSIIYNFVPLTPLPSQITTGFQIKTVSVTEVEY